MKTIIKLSVFGTLYTAFHAIFMLQLVGAKGLTMNGTEKGVIIALMLVFGFLFLKKVRKVFRWLYNAIVG